MKKIGIMGGTFNPIHHGHLFLAENAYEQIGLDKILFMPSNNPPHKSIEGCVTDKNRTDMIKLAIRNNPHFELSILELERNGLTYTADTLKILTEQYPDTEFYFIMGADSLLMLPKWKDPQTICSLCTIVASGRDHVEIPQLKDQSDHLKKIYNAHVLLLDMPTIEISSEAIRDRIAEKKSVRYYLPDDVALYIKDNRLYDRILSEEK